MVKTLAWQVRDPGVVHRSGSNSFFTIKNLPINAITLVLMFNDLSRGFRKPVSKILSDHIPLLGMIKLMLILSF